MPGDARATGPSLAASGRSGRPGRVRSLPDALRYPLDLVTARPCAALGRRHGSRRLCRGDPHPAPLVAAAGGSDGRCRHERGSQGWELPSLALDRSFPRAGWGAPPAVMRSPPRRVAGRSHRPRPRRWGVVSQADRSRFGGRLLAHRYGAARPVVSYRGQ